jgi:hypothetical protein
LRDQFRYRLVDEPRAGPLSKLALPPILMFIVATVLLPWGFLLITANAIALNGPNRNREVALSLGALGCYYGTIALLDLVVGSNLLANNQAHYVFVTGVGLGLTLLAFAFVSQQQAYELRRYLKELGQ